jgi:hypothetical protein
MKLCLLDQENIGLNIWCGVHKLLQVIMFMFKFKFNLVNACLRFMFF